MYEFVIEIAGKNIGLSSRFEILQRYCEDFLTDAVPDFCINVSDADIEFEREKSAREDRLEGKPVTEYPVPYLESLAVYRRIAEKMLEFDTILFHGSALSVDGEGYLFTAKSGTGKSTHTGFWRETFGDRAVMVNDDKPLLRITPQGVWVCGTPWNGKHFLSTNIMVPLKGLCILTRAEENTIVKLTAEQAMPMLLQQSHRPTNPAKMVKLLQLLQRLTEQTGLYRLGCNLDPVAAKVAYEGMNRKDN